MNTERNLNELMAECSADLQLLGLLNPEPEHSVARQLQAGRDSVRLNHGLSSVFICAFVAMAALVLFALTLLGTPVVTAQSAAHSPGLLDGEMAVIYRFEHAQTDSYAQVGAADSFATLPHSEIDWLQIVHQLNYQLKKALMIKQLHRLVRLQKNTLYKLKYSGLV